MVSALGRTDVHVMLTRGQVATLLGQACIGIFLILVVPETCSEAAWALSSMSSSLVSLKLVSKR